MSRRRRRGQFVLLASVAVALAFVVLLTAFLQLGYQGDVTTREFDRPVRDAERALERTTQDAAHESRRRTRGPSARRR